MSDNRIQQCKALEALFNSEEVDDYDKAFCIAELIKLQGRKKTRLNLEIENSKITHFLKIVAMDIDRDLGVGQGFSRLRAAAYGYRELSSKKENRIFIVNEPPSPTPLPLPRTTPTIDSSDLSNLSSYTPQPIIDLLRLKVSIKGDKVYLNNGKAYSQGIHKKQYDPVLKTFAAICENSGMHYAKAKVAPSPGTSLKEFYYTPMNFHVGYHWPKVVVVANGIVYIESLDPDKPKTPPKDKKGKTNLLSNVERYKDPDQFNHQLSFISDLIKEAEEPFKKVKSQLPEKEEVYETREIGGESFTRKMDVSCRFRKHNVNILSDTKVTLECIEFSFHYILKNTPAKVFDKYALMKIREVYPSYKPQEDRYESPIGRDFFISRYAKPHEDGTQVWKFEMKFKNKFLKNFVNRAGNKNLSTLEIIAKLRNLAIEKATPIIEALRDHNTKSLPPLQAYEAFIEGVTGEKLLPAVKELRYELLGMGLFRYTLKPKSHLREAAKLLVGKGICRWVDRNTIAIIPAYQSAYKVLT